MTPEQAVAREAIRYTQSVYNIEGDRGRVDLLAGTFTEDGCLELEQGAYTGRAAIEAFLGGWERTRTAGSSGRLRHHLSTSRIEFVNEHEADAWTYFFVATGDGPDRGGQYVDRFLEVDDRWLIQHRKVVMGWISPAGND